MLEHWTEIREIGRMREESIRLELQDILLAKKLKEARKPVKLHYLILDNLGKAFSTIGYSLQSQYHFESDKNIRKVS